MLEPLNGRRESSLDLPDDLVVLDDDLYGSPLLGTMIRTVEDSYSGRHRRQDEDAQPRTASRGWFPYHNSSGRDIAELSG